MASTYKRLYAGYGALGQATLAYTVPGSTQTVLKEVNVTQANAVAGPQINFGYVYGLAFDTAGNMYYAENTTCVIRKVAPDGKVSILAGMPGSSGNTDGVGSVARFSSNLGGLATDPSGTYLYVCDYGNNRVKRVTVSDGTVLTIAGNGTATNTDNATGTSGTISGPWQCVVSPDNATLYVACQSTTTVRKVTLSAPYALGSMAAGIANSCDHIRGIDIDSTGTWLYLVGALTTGTKAIILRQRISDSTVVVLSGAIANSAGFANSLTGSATYNYPNGIVLDESGVQPRLYISDNLSCAIRVLDFWMSSATTLSMSSANSLTGSKSFNQSSGTPTQGSTNGYPDTALFGTCLAITKKNGAVYFSTYGTSGSYLGGGIWRTGLQDSFCNRFAGGPGAAVFLYGEGNALQNTTGYFNLYVVPSGESLDYGKHCRFRSVAVNASEAFFAEINKSLQAGDKIYVEPLTPGLVFELSGLEVA